MLHILLKERLYAVLVSTCHFPIIQFWKNVLCKNITEHK